MPAEIQKKFQGKINKLIKNKDLIETIEHFIFARNTNSKETDVYTTYI